MSLNGVSVTINGKTITNAFQMASNAGLGKILACDQAGNGTWAEASLFNDMDWLEPRKDEKEKGKSDILYSNPKYSYIGVGTENPSEALEVCHRDIIGGEAMGGIAINQLNTDSIIKKNEIKFSRNGVEEWAIGSYYDPRRLAKNSFFIWNNILHETAFFISENGMTGISTSWPCAKLDVNGSFKASQIGINTNPPPADSEWKLLVEGGIKAREIKVTTTSFPDYVFGKDYPLMKISELDQFVKTNHRLPGLPSADEIEGNGGVEVGAMQNKLLEKIEEQSLYIISLQQQVDELKAMILSVKEAK